MPSLPHLKYHAKKTVYMVVISFVLSLGSWALSAQAMNVIETQDYADNLARQMSKDGPNRKVLAEYLRVCAALKLHSSNDWCTISNMNRRWIGYARTHGFLEQVDKYRKLNETPSPAPKKKKNLYSQEYLYQKARQQEALEAQERE